MAIDYRKTDGGVALFSGRLVLNETQAWRTAIFQPIMSVVPTPVNLALLICDELPAEFNYGTTTEIYDRWLSGSYPQGVLPRLNMMPYDVRERQEYPTAEELETIDAVMLTGSR